jgi:ATP-dependent exoDNAse (exonuclease V) alpha subunit
LNKFNELRDKIINSNESYFITGPGGSGKTELIKQLQQEITKRGKKYESLAPTNLAALLIGGITIHRFASKFKKSSVIKSLDIDYIFVDEVSMMAEMFYKFLLMIKRIRPDIKIIISGDFNQLPAVNDRISQYTDYGNSPCLFELSDFNKIQLTICRRSDDTLFKLLQFDNIKNLKSNHFTETSEYDNNFHICHTNETRKHINEIKMKQLYNKKSRHGFMIPKNIHDDRSQDMILNKTMPIIAKVNKEKLEIFNNQRYTITKIDKKKNIILIENEYGTKEINIDDFNKYFIPGYSATCHSVQGLSISEKYTVHEFNKMSIKLKYVALTRAKKLNQIHIKI